MTAAPTAPPEASETVAKTTGEPEPARHRWSRWKLLTPYAVAVLLVLLTAIAVEAETPDTDDADYLSPAATSRFGGDLLADALRARGVTVDVTTDADQAAELAGDGNSTLFIPAPEFPRIDQLSVIAELPEGTRVVLVRPGRARLMGLTGLTSGEGRLATGIAAPGCDVPAATAAGPAEVDRDSYAVPEGMEEHFGGTLCYDGSVAFTSAAPGGPEYVVVGAAAPFTNDRFDEAGNAALATGILSTRPHLVWLDIHATEKPPPPPPFQGGDPTDQPTPEPYDPPDAAAPDNPLYAAFPAWMWALLIGGLILFVLAALVRGRRLGPPIAEPLPVAVPAAETVYGRARLYRRGGSRAAALRAMRDGARHRLVPAVGLPSTAEPEQVVEALAARTGQDAESVRRVLYGPDPESDQDLLNSIHALDSLEYAVLGQRRQERHRT